MKPSLSTLSFLEYTCGVMSRSFLYPRPSAFSFMLSSGSFTVLCFSCFRSLIHFELVFVKNVGYVSRFDILHVGIPLFQLDSL